MNDLSKQLKIMLLNDKRHEIIEKMQGLQFNCCEDEFLYDCLCDDLEAIEAHIEKLYNN
jgi:hypothetical protein